MYRRRRSIDIPCAATKLAAQLLLGLALLVGVLGALDYSSGQTLNSNRHAAPAHTPAAADHPA
jgi:hypothetical protein